MNAHTPRWLAAFFFAAALTPAMARPHRSSRYPLRLAGLTVGKSTDPVVQRLYGPGYFATGEGHMGGRYYVDPARQVTLHVEIGTDRLLETVSYGRGVRLPASARKGGKIPSQAITRRLRPNLPLGRGVTLGMTPIEVRRHWGKPQ